MANKHKNKFRKITKRTRKNFKRDESNKSRNSKKLINNAEDFSYESVAQMSTKERSHQIKPDKIHQSEGTNEHRAQRPISGDLQEPPALKYKKVTYLSVIEGKELLWQIVFRNQTRIIFCYDGKIELILIPRFRSSKR